MHKLAKQADKSIIEYPILIPSEHVFFNELNLYIVPPIIIY